MRPRALAAAAVFVLLLAIAGAAIRFLIQTGRLASAELAAAEELVTRVAIAIAVSCLLAGLAAGLRLLRNIRAAVTRIERFQYEVRPLADHAAPASASGDSDSMIAAVRKTQILSQEMVILLRDLRDNSLLSDEERVIKRQRVAEDEILNAESLLRSLIEQDNFTQAREMAEAMSRKYPDKPQAVALVQQVEQSRENREASDVRNIVKQVGDLINISAWDRARSVASQLQQRHPDSVEAGQLIERIEREYQVFQAEQRRRMYAEIQRYVSRRRWGEALAAARTFIERFPQSEEADSLRVQLDTLQNNADVETRQELEAEITDLARHGRYIEAADLAKKVIKRYPDSPQADVLRSQLGRLEELAHNPDAPPARVRID